MKVGDLNLTQVGSGSFVNISNTWNNVQIQAFQQSLHANPKAMNTASSLNDMLRQRNLLPQDQQVVGFFGGKFFTMNANASRSNSSTNGTTTNGTTSSGTTASGNNAANPQTGTTSTTNATNVAGSNANASMPTTNAMMEGLVNVNVTNITNIQAQNVINVNGSMSAGQIRSLAKLLNSNPQARRNADLLTQQLRQKGLLAQNQSVMGFQNGRVFTGPSSAAQGNQQGSGGAGSLPDDDDSNSTDPNRRRDR